LFNLVIALPAAAFFLTHDHGTPGRPVDALGDVALFCVAALSRPALFVAPLAARWSARAAISLLRRLFALALPSSQFACYCRRELGAWARRRIRV
jgi:hypothetical protein